MHLKSSQLSCSYWILPARAGVSVQHAPTFSARKVNVPVGQLLHWHRSLLWNVPSGSSRSELSLLDDSDWLSSVKSSPVTKWALKGNRPLNLDDTVDLHRCWHLTLKRLSHSLQQVSDLGLHWHKCSADWSIWVLGWFGFWDTKVHANKVPLLSPCLWDLPLTHSRTWVSAVRLRLSLFRKGLPSVCAGTPDTVFVAATSAWSVCREIKTWRRRGARGWGYSLRIFRGLHCSCVCC